MSKSNELYEKAKKIMPGGVSSPVRAFKAVNSTPLFIERGEGAYLYDVDGKKYCDYVMSFGPLIFGHTDPVVMNAISEVLDTGTSFGAPIQDEIRLAQLMIEYNRGLEWVRFVNSGTEAVMSAIRLARGATGRNKLVKFKGCYHGHVDPLLVKAGSGLATFSIASSAGIPESVTNDTFVLPLGDFTALHEVFENEGSEIAAVIIEGIPANMGLFPQSKEFLDTIQKLCHKYGTIFILDEVITGFRLSKGGATAHYGLNPDLIIYGKIIGGGLPVGAYGGKLEFMNLVSPNGNVYQAGTLSGNPLAMRAGIAALSQLSDELYETLEKAAQILYEGIKHLSQKYDIPLQIRRVGSILWFVFQEASVEAPDDIIPEAEKYYSQFHSLALLEKLYMPPSAYEVCFISSAHTPEIISETLSKFEIIFQKMQGGLSS